MALKRKEKRTAQILPGTIVETFDYTGYTWIGNIRDTTGGTSMASERLGSDVFPSKGNWTRLENKKAANVPDDGRGCQTGDFEMA
jgi:hypothetical protein